MGLPFRFQEVTDELGIRYETMGAGISDTTAGVYINDFNDDGLEDVLLVAGEQPGLYQNTGERFERSEALPAVDEHLAGHDRVHSALFLDYDNDGWEDLLLLPGGGEVLADYTEPVENEPEETTSSPILLHNDRGPFSVEKILNVDLARLPIGAATGASTSSSTRTATGRIDGRLGTTILIPPAESNAPTTSKTTAVGTFS